MNKVIRFTVVVLSGLWWNERATEVLVTRSGGGVQCSKMAQPNCQEVLINDQFASLFLIFE